MKGLKIFRNSRVIITGHTGFKGSWLTAWLKQLGAKIMGISLDPPTYPSHLSLVIITTLQTFFNFLSDSRTLRVPKTLVCQVIVGFLYDSPTKDWAAK